MAMTTQALEQKRWCDTCQSWRLSPFNCGRDECTQPEAGEAGRAVLPSVRVTVNALHAGQDGEGPLESTDLHIVVGDVSILCNVLAGERFTYSVEGGGVSQCGTVGDQGRAVLPRLREELKHLRKMNWLSDLAVLRLEGILNAADPPAPTEARSHE